MLPRVSETRKKTYNKETTFSGKNNILFNFFAHISRNTIPIRTQLTSPKKTQILKWRIKDNERFLKCWPIVVNTMSE